MLNQETLARMAENVAAIRRTMAEAARKAGRDAAEIRLCAACKTRTVEEVRASADLAIDLFGENHVQELVEKTDAGAYAGKPGHFIGHLQTNKVNKVVGRAAVIESVDSERLLQKIEAAAARAGLVQDVLIEVNIGAETSKSGIAPESLWPLAEAAEAVAHLRLRGLMDLEVILAPDGLRVLEIDARFPSQTPTAVWLSTGWNLAEYLVSCFIPYEPAPGWESPRCVRYEHVCRTEDGEIVCRGEHVMAGAGPLEGLRDFFGADEALLGGDFPSGAWAATLMFHGATPEEVEARRDACLACLRAASRGDGHHKTP